VLDFFVYGQCVFRAINCAGPNNFYHEINAPKCVWWRDSCGRTAELTKFAQTQVAALKNRIEANTLLILMRDSAD